MDKDSDAQPVATPTSGDIKQESHPVAMVTGGSSGLGLVVAKTFLDVGYRVMIVGRDQNRIDAARKQLGASQHQLIAGRGDLTRQDDVDALFSQLRDEFGRLDALVNCAGASDRGLAENLSGQRLVELVEQNVVTALHCSQAAIDLLEKSRGVIVNIGSLAAKVGARYIGGYAAAKHALAGLTQQLRLELKPKGIHVALVNPGPIRRDDAGNRYLQRIDDSMPDQASQPGGGTRVKGLDPEKVARKILRCVQKRRVDIIMPGYMRPLVAIGHAIPSFGDWLLLKFTSVKEKQ